MTRVYIAGPMAGYPAQNVRAFRAAALALEDAGHDPLVPLDVYPDTHDGPCPRSYSDGPDHSAACYLRVCIQAMLDCDEIHLLPGWEASVGSRLELSVAAAAGLRVSFAKAGDQ